MIADQMTGARNTVQEQADVDSNNSDDLSPQLAKELGQLLERDWTNRPEWAHMLTALLQGKPMGMGMGWWQPSHSRYAWNWLREQFDANLDDKVVLDELPERFPERSLYFERLDRNGDGELTVDDFDWSARNSHEQVVADRPRRAESDEQDDSLSFAKIINMFLSGQFGWLNAGPELETEAIDFTLPTYDGTSNVTISDWRGKKPVVLIFGSFT